MKGDRNGETYLIQDSPEILSTFAGLYKNRDAALIAEKVLGNTSWWGADLTKIEGLQKKVTENLQTIWKDGMKSALSSL